MLLRNIGIQYLILNEFGRSDVRSCLQYLSARHVVVKVHGRRSVPPCYEGVQKFLGRLFSHPHVITTSTPTPVKTA